MGKSTEFGQYHAHRQLYQYLLNLNCCLNVIFTNLVVHAQTVAVCGVTSAAFVLLLLCSKCIFITTKWIIWFQYKWNLLRYKCSEVD